MFRVSPWITYDPAPEARQEGLTRTNNHFYNMADDVDMDAPQISTLRDDESPEPQPTPSRHTGKFRVKLLVNENKAKKASSSRKAQSAPSIESEDDDEDEDDEEDQLIDDDDDAEPQQQPKPPPPPIPAPVEPRTTAPKRGTGTGRGRGRGRGGPRRRGGRAAAAADTSATTSATTTQWADGAPAPTTSGRGRRGGGRGGAPKVARKRQPKQAKTALPAHLVEEPGNISESYAGTAASSPAAHDDHTPEPMVDVITHAIPISHASILEDINLEGVPIPSYPLPTKPFSVQPPQKIGTGFAPVIPLDKSGKKVRHWRQANREIRGIAGGRWFSKAWVGEKESDYASATAAAAAAALQSSTQAMSERDVLSGLSVTLPKLPGLSISGVGGRGTGRSRLHPKPLGGDSAFATNPSSRAQSIVSDSVAPTPRSLKRTHTQMSAASANETPAASTPAS